MIISLAFFLNLDHYDYHPKSIMVIEKEKKSNHFVNLAWNEERSHATPPDIF